MAEYGFKQLWFSHGKLPEIRTTSVSPMDQRYHQVLIKAKYSLVSSGTEKIILTEQLRGKLSDRMRVPYMAGGFDSEFTYGYSLTGQVIDGPESWLGKYVHVLHPHQEIAIVSENDILEIPDTIEPQQATLVSNLETIINAAWDSEISIGDNVLIVGAGIIGLLMVTVLKELPGITLTVLETNDFRRNLVDKMNVQTCKRISDQNNTYTITFNTSGTSEGLQIAIEKTREEGKIVELSWYGVQTVKLNLGDSFHYGRKKIISSQVSQIPAHKQRHFNHKKRKEIILDLLQSIDFSHCLNRKVPFEKAPSLYNDLINSNLNEPGILLTY